MIFSHVLTIQPDGGAVLLATATFVRARERPFHKRFTAGATSLHVAPHRRIFLSHYLGPSSRIACVRCSSISADSSVEQVSCVNGTSLLIVDLQLFFPTSVEAIHRHGADGARYEKGEEREGGGCWQHVFSPARCVRGVGVEGGGG